MDEVKHGFSDDIQSNDDSTAAPELPLLLRTHQRSASNQGQCAYVADAARESIKPDVLQTATLKLQQACLPATVDESPSHPFLPANAAKFPAGLVRLQANHEPTKHLPDKCGCILADSVSFDGFGPPPSHLFATISPTKEMRLYPSNSDRTHAPPSRSFGGEGRRRAHSLCFALFTSQANFCGLRKEKTGWHVYPR